MDLTSLEKSENCSPRIGECKSKLKGRFVKTCHTVINEQSGFSEYYRHTENVKEFLLNLITEIRRKMTV